MATPQPVARSLGSSLAHALLLTAASLQAQPPVVELVEVANGFSSAIGAASAGDGSGRIFVVQQSGEIVIWDGDAVLTTPFLDLSAVVTTGGPDERGLLGLAFHPDYESNGLFYVDYTEAATSPGDTVIARYTVSAGDADVADAGSELRLLTIVQPFVNHNGGDLHFGPDGFLYIASGDGGDSANAQDDTVLLGKILRLDVDGDDFPADPTRNYAVPPGNPLVGVAGADEIWSLGLRNPWRFSFDRENGDLFIGDVGEGNWEEVDHEPAGTPFSERNYGWACYEGDASFSGCGQPEDFTFPILTLPHDAPPDNNCSVIGGYRYRGSAYPALRGWYFFTDWCTGTVWAAEPDGVGGWNAYDVASVSSFNHTGFVEGDDGELYLVGSSQLLQLTDPTNGIFADGFEGGDTSSWSP